MDGRIIFRRARLVVASLATLLLFVGAASAVVTHEPPEPEAGASTVDHDAVRADVVGLTLAAPQSLSYAAVAEVEPEPVVVPETTTTTAPPTTTTTAPTTTTTAPSSTAAPAPTTTTTAPPPPPPTTTTVPPTTTTTAPPPTTTTVAATSDGPPGDHLYLSESQIRALVAAYFPASEVDKAVLVAQCESGWDAYVTGGSGGKYVGLFQHAGWVWESRAAAAGQAGKPWWDPEANVAVSAWLLNGDDWWHWSNCSSWADGQLGG